MEQFPSGPWVEATPHEAADPVEPNQDKEELKDPFYESTFVTIPEDIKDAFTNLQQKAEQTELPEIHIEE